MTDWTRYRLTLLVSRTTWLPLWLTTRARYWAFDDRRHHFFVIPGTITGLTVDRSQRAPSIVPSLPARLDQEEWAAVEEALRGDGTIRPRRPRAQPFAFEAERQRVREVMSDRGDNQTLGPATGWEDLADRLGYGDEFLDDSYTP